MWRPRRPSLSGVTVPSFAKRSGGVWLVLVKFELVSEDDQTNPDAGVRAARKLIDIDKVAAILGTRRTTQPDTPEGMVVRAADLADLAAGYDTFAANSEALRVEHERLSGTRVSLAEWRESVDQLLSDYLEERLWPLELLDDGSEQPGFHAAAKANLRRYLVSATDE